MEPPRPQHKPELSKVSVSLNTPIHAGGQSRADILFPTKRGGNFSAYVEWLIGKDLAENAASPSPLHLNDPAVPAPRDGPLRSGPYKIKRTKKLREP